MKRTALALSAAVLVTGLAGAAIAQHRMGGPGGMDPFGDATVTRAEAQAKAAEMFAKLDVNGDGRIDAADRTAAMAKRFDAMDANHDGMLSKQEFMDAHQKMMGHMGGGAMAGHDGPGGEGHRMGGMGHGGGMRGMMMLRQMDANGDKAITRDEFIAGALKRFDAADANHDGKLTPEERRTAMRQMMMRRHQMMGEHGGPGMGGMNHGGMDHDMGDMPPPPPK